MSRFPSRIALAITGLLAGLGWSVATVLPAHATNQVPLKATFTTVDTIYTGNGCPSVCFLETGSGQSTHLGAITSTGTGVVLSQTMLDPTHVQFTIAEQHTLTGANGDSITAVGTSTVNQDLSTGAFVVPPWSYTITQGTGRYAGATGSGLNSGSTQLNSAGTAATGTFTFDGTISTVGSLQ
jgi:hypothetical protein